MRRALLMTILILVSAFSVFSNGHPKAWEPDCYDNIGPTGRNDGNKTHRTIFGVFAEDREQLHHALILVESVRTFAGSFKDSPIWIYVPDNAKTNPGAIDKKFRSLEAEVKGSTAPEAALAFPYARKVFAAALGEAEAEGKAEVFVWLDDDTVFLQEPREFVLNRGVSFGYRPVMHQLIGSLYKEPLDVFWSRVYDKLSVPQSAVFPMTTPADSKTIRPYFNAGMLVVRPERGILRKWAKSFPVLYEDPVFIKWCEADRTKSIFLHQVALAGAVLNMLDREEMVELSPRFNYPVFFDRLFEAGKEFSSIEDAVTIRYDVFFRKAPPDWDKTLKGPKEKIAWLKERISRNED